MNLSTVLLVAAALFCVGIYGVLTRRSAIGVLIAVELMANAVNLNLVAFARYRADVTGQVFALFSIALTVAEVAVGLAIVILLYRSKKNVLTELAAEMKG
jgi:NADH-quinone oxidoreductase subunit K